MIKRCIFAIQFMNGWSYYLSWERKIWGCSVEKTKHISWLKCHAVASCLSKVKRKLGLLKNCRSCCQTNNGFWFWLVFLTSSLQLVKQQWYIHETKLFLIFFFSEIQRALLWQYSWKALSCLRNTLKVFFYDWQWMADFSSVKKIRSFVFFL